MRCKLSDICIGGGSYGIGASAVEYSLDLPTYLRISDINDDGTLDLAGLKSVDDANSEKYYLSPNDIVFARTGASTGRNYFYDGSDGQFVYAGFLIKFSIDSRKVNPKFIKYYCQSKDYYDWISSFNTGSTRGNINAQTLGNMDIPELSRAQQEVLVATLSALDDKIALNTKINRNLEQMAQAIFKSWFVDFEPWGGVMPEGWREVPLGKLIDIKHGYAFKGEHFSDEPTDYLLVTPGNFAIGGGFQEKPKYYKGPIPNEYILQKDDLIVTMTDLSKQGDTLGYSALVPEDYRYLHNQRIGLVSVKNNLLLKEYIYWLMRTHEYQRFIVNHASGSTVKHTSPKTILSYQFILPDNNTLEATATHLSVINQLISLYNAESARLAALRDTLLPRLMSGELSVADVDALHDV